MAVKIAIDAGHGLYTSGKRCLKSIDKKETREWTLNQRIATKLVNILKNYNCQTKRMDDVDGSTDVSLSARCTAANKWGADFYLSVHHNAGVNGGSGGGVEIFAVTGASSATKSKRDTLYKEVIEQTGLKGNRANPKTTANFYVLRKTSMPAVLIECGYMDSKTDTPVILTKEFADQCATGLANGLIKIFGLKKKSGSTTSESDFKPYTVTVNSPDGKLNIREKASDDSKLVDVLKNGSTKYTIVGEKDGWGKLKSGIGYVYLKYTTRC